MDKEKILASIGIGSAVIILGFVAGEVFQYLVKAILARFLGPELNGVYIQSLAITKAVSSFICAVFALILII